MKPYYEEAGPLAIDLFCGLGGWAEGFLAEGFRVIGFDIERHDYGTGGYPGQLVLQDVTTLDGSQFKDAAVIVASPPCQEFSHMAMPWKRAKHIERALREEVDWFPDGYKGSRTTAELTRLFDACFRIQREACEAAGRYIPLVVENVRGAQKWVGKAKANFGSYYLWGDVGMAGRRVVAGPLRFGVGVAPVRATKNNGGSWFAIAHNTTSGHSRNPVSGVKAPGMNWSDQTRRGQDFTRLAGQHAAGRKVGKDWFGGYGGGFGWDSSPMRRGSSKSKARKAASAMIAKIPLPLARHVARTFQEIPA